MPLVSKEFLYYLKSYGVILTVSVVGATPFAAQLIERFRTKKTAKQLLNILEPPLNMTLSVSRASLVETALKMTKLTVTASRTYIWENKECFCKNAENPCFSNTSRTAKNIPHRTKFQDAPCHSPVRNHTTAMLKNQRLFFTRLPPIGI